MKNKKRGIRMLAWSLIFALGISYLPVNTPFISWNDMKQVEAASSGQDENGFCYTSINGEKEAAVIAYKGNDTDIVIPAMFEGLPVTTIAAGAFNNNANIKTLRVGSNVTTIEKNAIYNLQRLEELIISGSVTSLANSAIYNTPLLKRLIIENGEGTLELKRNQFVNTAEFIASDYKCFGTLQYLEIGKQVVFENENMFSDAQKLAKIVVDKNNPYYTVQYNILFDKKQTTIIRGFAEAEFIGIPASVTRIASNALNACAGITWFSVEGTVPFGSKELQVFGKTALMYYPEDMPEWHEVSYLTMPDSMRIPITADMKRVKDTVMNLSLTKLKAEDIEKIKEIRALYAGLSTREKIWVEDLCDLSMLDQAEEWIAGLEVQEIVSALPDPEDLTIEHKDIVEDAYAKFDALTEVGKQALDATVQYKLRLAKKKIHDIQQVSLITPAQSTFEGAVGESFRVKVDVQPLYALNQDLSYESEDDQIAGVTKLSSRDGFTLELKKPGETVITATAVDSDANGDTSMITAEVSMPVLVRLPAPQNVVAEQLYTNSVEVTWSPVRNAVAYEVYRSEDGGEPIYIGTTTTGEKIDSNLPLDKTYTYQVVAVYSNTAYNSLKSQGSSCELELGKPEKLKGTGKSGSGVSLSWDVAAGAVTYEIYRNAYASGTFKLIGTSEKNSYKDKTAADGTSYYYKVVAVSGQGTKSEASGLVRVSVPLKTVSGLTAKKASDKSVKLTWKAVSGANRYNVYRSTSKNGTYTKITTITKTTYTDSKISNNKTYYYKVQAENTSVKLTSAMSSSVVILIPSKVSSFKAVRSSKTAAKLTWKKVSKATGYEIYRSTSKSSGFKKIATIKKSATVSYNDKSIKNNKVYYYKIRCYWKSGSQTVYTGYSSTVQIKKK